MIEVGDRIAIAGAFGHRNVYTVHRVTKARAYIRVNPHAELAFVRAFRDPDWLERYPRDRTWATTFYTLERKR